MLREILKQSAQWLWVARYSLTKYDSDATLADFSSLTQCIRALCRYAYRK